MSVEAPDHAHPPGTAAVTANATTPGKPRARWVAWLLVAVVGLVAAVAIGRSVTGGTVAGDDVVVVQLDVAAFAPAAVEITRGSSLAMSDLDDGEPHFLANGQWADVEIVPAAGQAGAPVLDELEVDGGTVPVGPFAQEGVFPIYCSIHPGMNLVVTVT